MHDTLYDNEVNQKWWLISDSSQNGDQTVKRENKGCRERMSLSVLKDIGSNMSIDILRWDDSKQKNQ